MNSGRIECSLGLRRPTVHRLRAEAERLGTTPSVLADIVLRLYLDETRRARRAAFGTARGLLETAASAAGEGGSR